MSFERFLAALTASCDAAEQSHPAAPLSQLGYGVRRVEIVQDPNRPVRLVENSRGVRVVQVPPEEICVCGHTSIAHTYRVHDAVSGRYVYVLGGCAECPDDENVGCAQFLSAKGGDSIGN